MEFSGILIEKEAWHIIHLDKMISEAFPSRGMVQLQVSILDRHFKVAAEPDGQKKHWFNIPEDLVQELLLKNGDLISGNLEVLDEWFEPTLADDVKSMLQADGLEAVWEGITTKAKWEWIRWIRSTKNGATRLKRINTASDMLSQGKKRPCCFDVSRCTIEAVSTSGVLNID